MIDYLVEATQAERSAELARCVLAREALAANPRTTWWSRLTRRRNQTRARRARSSASAAGHSLSMTE